MVALIKLKPTTKGHSFRKRALLCKVVKSVVLYAASLYQQVEIEAHSKFCGGRVEIERNERERLWLAQN